AISTRMPPRTSPVNNWAARRESERSATRLGEALLGARALQLLAGRDLSGDVEVSPFALGGRTSLDDPQVLERLVVARAPVLLALVVVVDRILAQRVGDGVGVGGLGQLHAACDFLDPAVTVARVAIRRHVEALRERFNVALGLRHRVLKLPVEVGGAVDVLEYVRP